MAAPAVRPAPAQGAGDLDGHQPTSRQACCSSTEFINTGTLPALAPGGRGVRVLIRPPARGESPPWPSCGCGTRGGGGRERAPTPFFFLATAEWPGQDRARVGGIGCAAPDSESARRASPPPGEPCGG